MQRPNRTTLAWRGGSNQEQATVIHVTDGSTISSIDISMKRFSGAISGTISAKTSGTPLSGIQASVCIPIVSYHDDCSWQTTSNQDGTYQITGLPPGSYDVLFSSVSASYLSDELTAVTVVDGATTQNMNVQLERGGEISGTLHAPVCPDGSFSSYSHPVYLYDAISNNYITSGYADINGTYRIKKIPTGTYNINFNYPGYSSQWYNNKTTRDAADRVTVPLDSLISGVDATFSDAGGSSIEGHVSDSVSGKGIFNLSMSCQSVNGANLTYYPCSGKTDSRGFFRVSGLPTGSYRIAFSGMGYLPGKYNGTVAADTNITNAQLALVKGSTITGMVTDAATKVPLANVRISFSKVSSAVGGTTGTATPSAITDIITDRNGIYRLKGLAAGDYYLKFDASKDGYIQTWYGGALQIANATAITVGAQANVSGINIALQKGGSISGIVTDAATGKALSGIQVFATGTASYYQYTATDAAGSYTIKGLPDDNYTFQFTDYNTGYARAWYNGRQTRESANPVTVSGQGAVTEINVALTVGGKISGKVYHAVTGDLQESLNVMAYDAVSGEYVSGTYISAGTAATGYTIGGLASGTYKIQAYKDSKVFGWYNGKAVMAFADTVTVTAPGTTSGIDIYVKEQDIQPPTITKFAIPSYTTSATIPVTFTATDNVAVTGYCISDSPDPARCNWQSAPPTSYLFEDAVANVTSIKWLFAFARDAAGNVSSYPPRQIQLSVPGYSLSVDFNGSGGGSVHSIPVGLSCIADCSAVFPAGLPVKVAATADSNSVFSGWSLGGCSGTGNCTVSLSANSGVKATFNSCPAVRIFDTTISPFTQISDAYKAAVAGKNTVIQARQIELTENLNLNKPVNIVFQGGFNSVFNLKEGFTTLKGIVTISYGSLTVENLVID